MTSAITAHPNGHLPSLEYPPAKSATFCAFHSRHVLAALKDFGFK